MVDVGYVIKGEASFQLANLLLFCSLLQLILPLFPTDLPSVCLSLCLSLYQSANALIFLYFCLFDYARFSIYRCFYSSV